MRIFAGMICAVAVGLQPLGAIADEQGDAAAITNILLSDEVVEATFGAFGTLMGDLMIAEFQKNNVEISDQASLLFSDLLLAEMVDQMGPALRDTQRDIYTLSA